MKNFLTIFICCLALFSVTLSGFDAYGGSIYELEPNENSATATPFQFGDKIIGNMWHALDYDWYSVNIPSSGIVTLTSYYDFPSSATEDADVLFVELRDSSNSVLDGFYVNFRKESTPDIRDIYIPSSGTYYIVAHCPSLEKFKRNRYYLAMTGNGASTAYIDLSSSTESVPADGKTSLTLTAKLYDSSGAVVPKNTQAIFYASSGSFLNGLGSYIFGTTDASGSVKVSLLSSTAAGKCDVTCYSNGVTQLLSVYFGGDTGVGTTTSITLAASPTSISADGAASSTITITMKDSTGQPVSQGTPATLTTTLGSLSRENIVTVDESGVISVSLTAGTEAGTARVVCTSNNITQTTTVTFTGGTATPAQLALSVSQVSVKTDDSDSAVVTATVLDASSAVIKGVPVSFSADGGKLSASLVETDENGEAMVEFSSGSIDKSNRVVTVTADVPVLSPKTIPVQVSGSTLSLAHDGTDLTLDDKSTSANEANSSVLTITAKDAGGNPVYEAPITITSVSGKTGSLTWTPSAPYVTDINGQVEITVSGLTAGKPALNIQGLGITTTQQYTVAVLSDSFGIVSPASELTNVMTTSSITVKVRAPKQTQVRFATSMGGLDNSDLQVKVVNVVNGYASVVVRSSLAGVATVEVSDYNNPDTVDRVSIAFSRPSSEAATIKVQTNTAVIAPSVGDNKSIAEFTAYVKTSGDTGNQAVADVPVVFSIEDATGSGESVSPVVVYTNEAGEAKTTFTAGSLGSDADGVIVTARVVGSGTTGNLTNTLSFTAPNIITRNSGSFITDGFKNNQQIKVAGSALNDGYYTAKTVSDTTITLDTDDSVTTSAATGTNIIITALTHSTNIVIGGTSGSVVIGAGANDSIEILNPTTYSYAMSVLVADLNGNPVPGATVSLSLWPEFYSTGVWYDLNDRTSDHYVPYITGTFTNEDLNENTFLDPGEDTNKDGILTPPNSAAGNIPMTVTTEANGVAEFSLVYLKSSSVWITARIVATTMVFGTETKASTSFRLPAEKTEAEAGYLPDSAYPYVLTCISGGAASFRLPAFAGSSADIFVPLRGTVTGVAGTEVDSNGDGTPDYYTSYDYNYADGGSTPGTVYYDFIAVSDSACVTTFPLKIIIE